VDTPELRAIALIGEQGGKLQCFMSDELKKFIESADIINWLSRIREGHEEIESLHLTVTMRCKSLSPEDVARLFGVVAFDSCMR